MNIKKLKLKILIPCLSVFSAACLIIPAAILTKSTKIKYDFPIDPETNIDGFLIFGPSFDMPFVLNTEISDDMSIYCSPTKLNSSIPNLKILARRDGLCQIVGKDCFAPLILVDEKEEIKPSLSCNLDITFTCKNSKNEVIWTQDIVQLCVRWL